MEQYPDKRKVYVRYFVKNGKRFIKVGITSFKDAEERVRANKRYDHRISWVDYFDDTKIIKSVKCQNQIHAESVEKAILEAWGPKDVNFPVNFSGIREFRAYTGERAAEAIKLVEIARKLAKIV